MASLIKHLRPFGLLLFAIPCAAQLPTNNITPTLSAVMTTNATGVLAAPTNFFTANAAAISAVAGAGSQSPLSTDVNAAGHAGTNYGSLQATNVNATNLVASNIFATNFIGGTHAGNGNGLTNLNATNLIGTVSTTNGGLGFANTNYIPVGQHVDGGGLAWETGGAGGYIVYGLNPSFSYACFCGGNNSVAIDTNAVVKLGGTNIVTPINGYLAVFAKPVSSLIISSIYLATNNMGGTFGGNFAGTFAGTFNGSGSLTLNQFSSVPTIALSNDVQLTTIPLAVRATNGAAENILMAANTLNGSTFSLINYGGTGANYADINFFTAPNLSQALGNPTLWGAIGVGNAGASFPYQQPYIESYLGNNPWYFVGGGAVYGGLFCVPGAGAANGDFIWFQDGTTNTPMFRVSRSNKVISNYYQAKFSSNVAALSFTQSANTTNGNLWFVDGSGNFYNSNGVPVTMLVGTIADARLSANVPLLNAASNVYSGAQYGNGQGWTNLQPNALATTNSTPSVTNNPIDLGGAAETSAYHHYVLTNDFWIPYLTNGVNGGHKRLEFECLGATNHNLLFPASFRKGGDTNLIGSVSGTNSVVTITNNTWLVVVVGNAGTANPNATNSSISIEVLQ